MPTAPRDTPLIGATVHPVRDHADADDFLEWLQRPRRVLAVDTETTGLNYFDEVRLVQVGDASDAWVLDPARHDWLIEQALLGSRRLVAHNAPFDLCHLARWFGSSIDEHLDIVEDLGHKTIDTALLAHLLDPRDRSQGGIGHALKDLARHYVDSAADDGQAVLKDRFRTLGFTMSTGWAGIDLWDPDYVRYAGLDAIITTRLFDALLPKVLARGHEDLVEFEHQVQRATTAMTVRGTAVDRHYADQLALELDEERRGAEAEAATYGVDNVNSTAQVAEALTARGVTLTEVTPSGKAKVDRAVLEALDDPLAQVVLEAKTASKALTAWVTPILDSADRDGRCHPRIRTLAARTGRMSISGPPLQQLPARDHRVRSCLIAEPGEVIISVDFSQVELRVLAALSCDPMLTGAFDAGLDIHSATAATIFGPDFTAAHRQIAKAVAFGIVYGGGAATLARQAGVDRLVAEEAIIKFNRAYPKVRSWAKGLTSSLAWGSDPFLKTPTGRRIPIDTGSEYRATNYIIQSTARDVFAGALLQLRAAGLDHYLRLPVHDEVVCSVPAPWAEEIGAEIALVMSGDLGGVPIVADFEVCGPRWGDKYAPKE